MGVSPPIRSIQRALSVLQTINRSGTLSMMDIALNTDMPYPTAYRIVQTLLHEGVIEREPTRKCYRPTALAQTLSQGFKDYGRLVAVARSHIVALTEKIGWPVTIATHVGHNMVVRDSTHTHTALTFSNYFPGYSLPILECAVGRAYLSFAHEQEYQSILNSLRMLPDSANNNTLAMFDNGGLREKIRSDGYAGALNNRFTQDSGKTSSFAIPLMEDGKVVGALALIFFSVAHQLDDAVSNYLPLLQKTANDISLALNQTEETGGFPVI